MTAGAERWSAAPLGGNERPEGVYLQNQNQTKHPPIHRSPEEAGRTESRVRFCGRIWEEFVVGT